MLHDERVDRVMTGLKKRVVIFGGAWAAVYVAMRYALGHKNGGEPLESVGFETIEIEKKNMEEKGEYYDGI